VEGRRSIESAIRADIREGRLAPGATVPSTRTLASRLGVARGAVVEAYAQLAAEGWLRTKQGAPTKVAPSVWLPHPLLTPARKQRAALKHDLFPGEPDLSIFPMSSWLAAMRKVASRGLGPALTYDRDEGSTQLRYALARYLERARGVVAHPEQIIICSGSADALATIARALAPGTIATEDPGLPYHNEVVASSGASVVPLPVDGDGASAEPGDVAAALLTPAHQFPLGMTCSAPRRDALIAWARRSGGLIIEDDYDGEFRFDREPIGAMQGRAPDDVVYIGTASKSLAPGLRLAWAVVPPRFLDAFLSARRWHRTVSSLDQRVLAELLDDGSFERHLRRSRTLYRHRRDDLVAAITDLDVGLDVLGVAAGLHAVIALPADGPDEMSVRDQALRSSLRLAILGPTWQTPPKVKGIIVGYSKPPAHAWRGALEALCETLCRALAPDLP
jgi:GntR family transcriptional regulator / MocR family aminotransferase